MKINFKYFNVKVVEEIAASALPVKKWYINLTLLNILTNLKVVIICE